MPTSANITHKFENFQTAKFVGEGGKTQCKTVSF